jgi:hypothetical protein
MNPIVRFTVRAALVGLLSALVSLQVNLPGISLDDATTALIGGAIAALAYAGIGAVTPLEPRVGVKAVGK